MLAGFAAGEGIKVANAASATLDASGKVLTVFDSGHSALGTITFSTSYAGDSFLVANNVITVQYAGDAVWLAAPPTNSFNNGANWNSASRERCSSERRVAKNWRPTIAWPT